MANCSICEFSKFTKEDPELFEVLSGKVQLECSLEKDWDNCSSFEIMKDIPKELIEECHD